VIPSIGIMVGFYVITRMISFASRSGDRAESALVRVMAVVTILVAGLVIMTLFGGGAPTTP
jgi:hypothetical protein